jgi:hypothetical protein
VPAYSPRRRAQIAPPRFNGAEAAAPRPRRRPGAAPCRTRGRCPPQKVAERPKRRSSRPKSGPATLSDRRPRGTPGRPPAGSEAPARAQPSPVSTLGGQSVQLAPRAASTSWRGVLRARTSPREPAPASLGQMAPCRPTAPATARRSHRRASTGAGAAAPRPRRRPGAAPRPARGRCPPRRPPKTAKTGQNGPRNGSDRCPRETPGRPPARSEAPARGQLGPFSTLGVRLASWHRASSARGFYLAGMQAAQRYLRSMISRNAARNKSYYSTVDQTYAH